MLIYKCSKCGKESFPRENYNSDLFYKCSCDSKNYVEVFPAILAKVAQGEKPEVALNEESTCFKHSENVAVAACDYCGVYMCNLCDLEIEGKHMCSECLKHKTEDFKTTRQKAFLYDELALHLTILPILFVYAFLITAPTALIMSITCFNKVDTPYKRGKWRFIVAFILGLIEVFAIAGIIISIAT
jgi:DNA-directed RNA polymerase subunit RPC12/RpoP